MQFFYITWLKTTDSRIHEKYLCTIVDGAYLYPSSLYAAFFFNFLKLSTIRPGATQKE